MKNTDISIEELVNVQRDYFNLGETLDLMHRKKYLKKLYSAIKSNEANILKALNDDLGKATLEAYMCEFGFVLSSLSHTIKNLKKWSKDKVVSTPITLFHSKSIVKYEPYGVALVLAPWNYPFMLSLEPLFSAIAAGNCCILKPSEYAPHTADVIVDIIESVFPQKYVKCVTGDVSVSEKLLNQRFDYIFFTGSVQVGKYVMQKASQNLTPVTLELGGKSPCIVDKSANIKVSAQRIAFGKFLNAGQTCVAPDYLLVDESIKDKFVTELKNQIEKMYTNDPLKNNDYVHIINKKHFDRISSLIDKNKVIFGGNIDEKSLRIEPTLIDNVSLDDAVMKEEIFGPVLPIITYKNINNAVDVIKKFEKPLALYLFSDDRKNQDYITKNISFGGGCINNTIMHLATQNMSFGGVGHSGMGSYHGIDSFKTFSHSKSILKTYNWINLPLIYQPYKKLHEKLIRFLLK